MGLDKHAVRKRIIKLRHEIITKYAALIGLFATEAWFLWNPKGWVFGWEPIVCFVGLLGAYISFDIKCREKNKKKTVSTHKVEGKISPPWNEQKNDGQLKSINLSLEEYFQRIESLKNRFLEKTEFIDSIKGTQVSWQATVSNVTRSHGGKVTICLRSLSGNLHMLALAHLPQEFETKAFSLREGDNVLIEGILTTETAGIPDIEANSLKVFTT